MSMFYTARHGALRTSSPSVAQRAGVGVLAATALGLGATTMTATGAAAQGGPGGTTQIQPGAGGTQSTSGSTSFSDVVNKGDTGNIVEQIQEKVGISADGVFGSETEQAVTAWQGENGLSADGIVGPQTGSRMGLSSSNAGSSSASTAETSDLGSSSSSSSSTAGVLGTAESLVGSPYVYGGTTPSGFDCSGFTQYVFAKHGKDLPRTAQQQMAAATPVSDPQPGDLVFFGDNAYHNGIYAGDGQMYDAGNSGSPVQKRDIWTDDVTYGRF